MVREDRRRYRGGGSEGVSRGSSGLRKGGPRGGRGGKEGSCMRNGKTAEWRNVEEFGDVRVPVSGIARGHASNIDYPGSTGQRSPHYSGLHPAAYRIAKCS